MWASIKGYIFALPYAIIVALLGVLLFFRYELANANADKIALTTENATLRDTNTEQEKTIKGMIALRDQEHKILLDLSDKVDTINKQVDETKSSVDDLQKSNEDVKAYLNNQLPADLNRLLNK